MITNEEAERRGKTYDANGMTYLFDLDYHDLEAQFTVDAGTYGNVSHFVNHSVSSACFSFDIIIIIIFVYYNCSQTAQSYNANIRHAGRGTTATIQGSTIYRRVKPAKLFPHTAHSD